MEKDSPSIVFALHVCVYVHVGLECQITNQVEVETLTLYMYYSQVLIIRASLSEPHTAE